jgi:hypothetical protein
MALPNPNYPNPNYPNPDYPNPDYPNPDYPILIENKIFTSSGTDEADCFRYFLHLHPAAS